MAISENYNIEKQDEWLDWRACSTGKQIIATDNLRRIVKLTKEKAGEST